MNSLKWTTNLILFSMDKTFIKNSRVLGNKVWKSAVSDQNCRSFVFARFCASFPFFDNSWEFWFNMINYFVTELELPNPTTLKVSKKVLLKLNSTLELPLKDCKNSTTRPVWPCWTTNTVMEFHGTMLLVISGLILFFSCWAIGRFKFQNFY